MRVNVPQEDRLLDMEDFRILAEAINRNCIESVMGMDRRESPSGVSFVNRAQIAQADIQSGIQLLRVFWAQVTGYSATSVIIGEPDDVAWRWKYDWQQVTFNPVREESKAGRAWTLLVPADTEIGTTVYSGTAYNWVEDMNVSRGSVSAIQGNGVDMGTGGSVPETMEIVPCPVGSIVQIHDFKVPSAGENHYYWFGHVNGIDGSCS